MATVSKKKQKNNSPTANTNTSANPTAKAKRTRKSVPRDSPPQRSSVYRGVTRHRWTGRYEAHLWDKNCWNESQNKKGRQVYLGAYDDEEAAAHAYDLAALKYWGQDTILNFPLSTYQKELKEMEGLSKEEYIGSLRRKSSGFARGVSKYRGVARHHHNGRWEARIGRVFGNKYLYLGTYATQEEAAVAYDKAAIEHRGLNAVTNFDLSRYIKRLCPNNNNNTNPEKPLPNPTTATTAILDVNDLLPNPKVEELGEAGVAEAIPPPLSPNAGGGSSASSARGLLLQSSKFKEMLDRTSAPDHCPSASSETDHHPRRSFPDDIQTYFDCQDKSSYGEGGGDDSIFGDLNSFALPIFHCGLDGLIN